MLGNATRIDLMWLCVHADGGDRVTVVPVDGRADLGHFRRL